jgi:hypothetical protein
VVGAVSFYIDHFISSRVARATYGSKCVHVFSPGREDHEKRTSKAFVAANGMKMLGQGFQAVLVKVRCRVTCCIILWVGC